MDSSAVMVISNYADVINQDFLAMEKEIQVNINEIKTL